MNIIAETRQGRDDRVVVSGYVCQPFVSQDLFSVVDDMGGGRTRRPLSSPSSTAFSHNLQLSPRLCPRWPGHQRRRLWLVAEPGACASPRQGVIQDCQQGRVPNDSDFVISVVFLQHNALFRPTQIVTPCLRPLFTGPLHVVRGRGAWAARLDTLRHNPERDKRKTWLAWSVACYRHTLRRQGNRALAHTPPPVHNIVACSAGQH